MKSREKFTAAQKKQMLLSTETLLGIRRSGKTKYNFSHIYIFHIVRSFIELVKFLFSLPEVKDNNLTFLSANLSQDPLENFFGCQRQRGGTNDNPTAQEYHSNTQALRVVNSFCRDPIRGNCRGNATRQTIFTESDMEPIPRRNSHKRKENDTE